MENKCKGMGIKRNEEFSYTLLFADNLMAITNDKEDMI